MSAAAWELAVAAGRKAGAFYTPESLVRLMVELVEPVSGTIYEPTIGSGGLVLSDDRLVAALRDGTIHLVGQEMDPLVREATIASFAGMEIPVDLGDRAADTLVDDRHPDLRADIVLANPPFNVKGWAVDPADPRWRWGSPTSRNANTAWLQHVAYHLAPNGVAVVVMPNGSLSSGDRADVAIRRGMVEEGIIRAIVTLPAKLFRSTSVPVCIWVLAGANRAHPDGVVLYDLPAAHGKINRAQVALSDHDIAEVVAVVSSGTLPTGPDAMVPLERLRDAEWILAPGRYHAMRDAAGTADAATDRIVDLVNQLRGQLVRSREMDDRMIAGLGRLVASNGIQVVPTPTPPTPIDRGAGRRQAMLPGIEEAA